MAASRQRARIIYPGGEERHVYPKNLKKFTLEELQSFVGGYIERVQLPRGNGHAIAYVNEDGLSKRLEYNWKASSIYNGSIVGPMVIVSAVKP